MDKSGRVFIDFHTGLQKFIVVGLRKGKGSFFIRNMGHDDADFHTTFCGIGQSQNHLMVQDQVRCHDMYIVLCRIQYIQIYLFSCPLITIWHHIIRDDISVIGHLQIGGGPVWLILQLPTL